MIFQMSDCHVKQTDDHPKGLHSSVWQNIPKIDWRCRGSLMLWIFGPKTWMSAELETWQLNYNSHSCISKRCCHSLTDYSLCFCFVLKSWEIRLIINDIKTWGIHLSWVLIISFLDFMKNRCHSMPDTSFYLKFMSKKAKTNEKVSFISRGVNAILNGPMPMLLLLICCRDDSTTTTTQSDPIANYDEPGDRLTNRFAVCLLGSWSWNCKFHSKTKKRVPFILLLFLFGCLRAESGSLLTLILFSRWSTTKKTNQ